MARTTARTAWTSRLTWDGQAAQRFAAAAMVVLVVLGATLGTAGAQTDRYTTKGMTRDRFIKACEIAGGTLEVYGSSTKCGWGSNHYNNCNWKTKKCSSHYPGFYPTPEIQTFIDLTHGEVGGGVAAAGRRPRLGTARPPTISHSPRRTGGGGAPLMQQL